jgi:hypothetical protein
VIDPDVREGEALKLLDEWPWRLGGVVIGGYAVSAYGPPRYSADVDVVVPYGAARSVRSWLKQSGFRLEQHAIPNPLNAEGQVARFKTRMVTVDVLTGAVRDRDAQVDIPQSWIAKSPRLVRLQMVSGSTQTSVPVARPEAVWALKLQAGRDSDLSDLFAIADEPIDAEDICRLFLELRSDPFVAKLRKVRSKLDGHRLYADSLSRRELGRPSDPANRRRWSRFVRKADRILRPVLEIKPA